MTPQLAATLLLAAAVVLGSARLVWWQWRAPPAARSRGWRLALLAGLQALAAGALYLSCFSPHGGTATSTLVVATEGASPAIPLAAGERLVALPEARGVIGAVRVPDLASALRSTTGVRAIRILGTGLVARDRPAAATVTVRFDAPPAPAGPIALLPPGPIGPGEDFAVAAQLGAAAKLELLDPAGRVVDALAAVPDRPATLHGTARVPGTAMFTLRVGGPAGNRIPVPLVTRAAPPVRVLIVAGAPGPEVKFLRRWAQDAGLAPAVQLGIGDGVLSDAGVAITPAALARIDAAILDDRAWNAMGAGARAAITQAVDGGMGLVMRVTEASPRSWRVLGLVVGGGAKIASVTLPAEAPGQAALAARRGPGTDDAPGAAMAPWGELPELTRLTAGIGGSDAVALHRDRRGAVFAGWRPFGRGRVAAVTLLDSFALVTSGNGDRHAELWSRIISAVGRARDGGASVASAWPREGERVVLCGVGDNARVVAPGGGEMPVLRDPSAAGRNCAGFWPARSGWHELTGAGGTPFYVHEAATAPSLRAAERRRATMALVGERPASPGNGAVVGDEPSWRWFAVFLLAAGLLWFVERARWGRGVPQRAPVEGRASG